MIEMYDDPDLPSHLVCLDHSIRRSWFIEKTTGHREENYYFTYDFWREEIEGGKIFLAAIQDKGDGMW